MTGKALEALQWGIVGAEGEQGLSITWLRKCLLIGISVEYFEACAAQIK